MVDMVNYFTEVNIPRCDLEFDKSQQCVSGIHILEMDLRFTRSSFLDLMVWTKQNEHGWHAHISDFLN